MVPKFSKFQNKHAPLCQFRWQNDKTRELFVYYDEVGLGAESHIVAPSRCVGLRLASSASSSLSVKKMSKSSSLPSLDVETDMSSSSSLMVFSPYSDILKSRGVVWDENNILCFIPKRFPPFSSNVPNNHCKWSWLRSCTCEYMKRACSSANEINLMAFVCTCILMSCSLTSALQKRGSYSFYRLIPMY